MSWMEKAPSVQPNLRAKRVEEGVWSKCDGCGEALFTEELVKLLMVCPKCDFHHHLSASQRLAFLWDEPPTQAIGEHLRSADPLGFVDSQSYPARLEAAEKNSLHSEALLVEQGLLGGRPLVIAAFEFGFMGGSMGSVVGERFVLAVKAALAAQCPLVVITASGGARMQEGLFSLMQMSKTTAALNWLRQRQLPFISVLTDPTMGGVSASFACIADIILAEPGALIGFAGPRVIEQTVRETLPDGFQRAEFLLANGAVDQVVHRHKLREKLINLLGLLHPAAE